MNKTEKEYLAAYYDSINGRTAKDEGLEKGNLVEDVNGQRFVVEALSQDYTEVKEYDVDGSAASWLKFNESAATQTWVAVKDSTGKNSVQRYGNEGLIKIEEKDFEKKPEHVKVDHSIMEAYSDVVAKTVIED